MNIGDTVVIKEDRNPPQAYLITKVGRKWIYAGTERCPKLYKFEKGSQYVYSNFGSPPMIYASMEEYERDLQQDRMWTALSEVFRPYSPRLSIEQMEKILEIINEND